MLKNSFYGWRAVGCGALSAAFMMAFIDLFYMLGVTPFAFELFSGSLIRGTQYGVHNWTLGFGVNIVIGGLLGLIYAYLFEKMFYSADYITGLGIGLVHALIASLVFFPFFCYLHESIETGLYSDFGYFGLGLGVPSFVLLIASHLLFGAHMGAFYNAVRPEKFRTVTGDSFIGSSESSEDEMSDEQTVLTLDALAATAASATVSSASGVGVVGIEDQLAV